MDNPLIRDAMNYVKEIFENDFGGHDYYHTIRVFKMATKIANVEKANIIIVQLAALLHDVDDRKLSPNTFKQKERATMFLKRCKIPEKQIIWICEIISEVSFSENGSLIPNSLEGKCVQDADRLDAMGAIGIARTFAFGGNNNRPMYNPQIPPGNKLMDNDSIKCKRSTSINHFYEKLLLLKNLMNTKTGIEIAEKRDQYMREFLDEFFSEINGDN